MSLLDTLKEIKGDFKKYQEKTEEKRLQRKFEISLILNSNLSDSFITGFNEKARIEEGKNVRYDACQIKYAILNKYKRLFTLEECQYYNDLIQKEQLPEYGHFIREI